MPNENSEFRALMWRIQEGSEDAAWELVEQYGDRIRRTVRRALNSRLRSKFDSLDFVQIVWSSFFRVRDRLCRFARPEDLAAYLMQMSRNKVGMELRRRLQTEKYNVDREHSLDESGVASQIAADDPTPLNVAIAREQWNRILDHQPEHYRQIVQLRLRGHTHEEIAAALNLAECTVRRVLKRLFCETVT
jgi:RNA polymerase sigma factor (sigma-70 family)